MMLSKEMSNQDVVIITIYVYLKTSLLKMYL